MLGGLKLPTGLSGLARYLKNALKQIRPDCLQVVFMDVFMLGSLATPRSLEPYFMLKSQ
jgi:hypothetical protein